MSGSDAQRKIPAENLALLTNPVPYEEVILDGREFAATITPDNGLNYHVLKYTVPVGKGGYYSYDDSRYGSHYRYICNEEQYEALCHGIETAGEPVSATESVECLEYELYFPLSYQLEEGQDYYFISAWSSVYSYKAIDLVLIREIDITLDNSGAASEGTTTLYSKGNEWCVFSSREWYDRKEQITLPKKSGYLFEGYYTAADGLGIQVIDDRGKILPAMKELGDNCTVYASWRPFSPISYQEIRLEDRTFSKVVTGGLSPYYQVFKFSVPEGEGGFYTFYNVYRSEYISAAGYLCTSEQYEAMCHKIEQGKGAVWSPEWSDFGWHIHGTLPTGLSINEDTGCITGIPTESGTKKFTIIAYNSQITVSKEFVITINDQISSNDSDNSDDQLDAWIWDASGNWRYGSGRYYCVNEWKFLAYNGVSNWYYFGTDGYIVTGWMMDGTGGWYYLNPVSDGSRGAMQTGWLTDPSDGNCYYLDLQTGKMVTGWVNIEGTWYYFTEFNEAYAGWKWDEAAGAWQYEDVGQRPTGALELSRKRDV